MDTRERLRLELDSDGELRFQTRESSDLMDGICAGCGCRVGDHWIKLHGDALGHVGCNGARTIAEQRRTA